MKMETINQQIERVTRQEWEELPSRASLCVRPPRIEWDLQVELSHYPQFDRKKFPIMLMNLLVEVQDHSKSVKRRVSTFVDGGGQRIEFAWEGDPLGEEVIRRLNKKYQGEGEYHGSRIAGDLAREIGATLTIENFEDPPYRVRNVVKLPLT